MFNPFQTPFSGQTEEQRAWIKEVMSKAEALFNSIDKPRNITDPGNREIAMSKTRLEESIMWAVKGITA